jgi:hypothetical protein
MSASSAARLAGTLPIGDRSDWRQQQRRQDVMSYCQHELGGATINATPNVICSNTYPASTTRSLRNALPLHHTAPANRCRQARFAPIAKSAAQRDAQDLIQIKV